MTDIFDNVILCKKCNKEMLKTEIEKDGFLLRAIECPKCKDKIIHPADISEYQQFKNLRDKNFRVKLRLVGNSYTVSIPKQIVDFIHEQEKMMDDMVRLCFEEAGRLSLIFNEQYNAGKNRLNKKIIR